MKSQNIGKIQASGVGSHSRVSLNKLHFDFRNATLAFLSVSCSQSDDTTAKPDVEQTEPSCNRNSRKLEHNRVDLLKCSVDTGGTDAAEICKTAGVITGSAVQVDDGDSDRPVDDSDAAAVRLHSCSAVATSEPTDRNQTFTTECTQLTTDGSVPETNILPVSDSQSSLRVPSLLNKRTDLCYHRERKTKCTNNSVAENTADVRVAHDIGLKHSSVRVKASPREENMERDLCSSSCNYVEWSGSGTTSENCFPSSTVASDVYDYASDDVSSSDLKKSSVHAASPVKKSLRSKNAHFLDTVTVTSNGSEAKCKFGKLVIVRTPKRRQKIKSDPEGEVWSTQKKLLIMPIDKKLPKSGGRSRKRITGVTRSILEPLPKCKRRKSFSVTGMEELPDLGTTLDSSVDESDLPNVSSSQVSDVDNNALSDSTSRKWLIDITGADLTMDSDIQYEPKVTVSSDEQKCLVPDKAAEQNVNCLVTQYATDAECCHTNFSGSQVTPPPSVASDGFSSCDESDHFPRSSAQDEVDLKSSNSPWLTIDTRVAHYIDGRRFDRLVNGMAVQIPAILTQETVAQFGHEYLRLEKLTNRNLKELQNQVRLEEIYHRRAKKTVLPLHNSINERVKHRAFWQHNVSSRTRRSAAKLSAESHLTDGRYDIETEAAVAYTGVEQDTSLAVSGQCQLAEPSDDDTVSYPSSDETEKSEQNNPVSKPDGIYTSELLESNVTETSKGADGSCINNDGSAQQESPAIRVLIRRRVHADKNQSQVHDQLDERTPVSTPVSIAAPEQTSSALRNCTNSSVLAVSDSTVLGDSIKAIPIQMSARKPPAITSFHPTANQPAVNSVQHAMMDAVTAKTDMSDTVRTGESEYIAAIALASLSVVTDSIETAFNHSQTGEEHNVNKADPDLAVISKLAHDSLPPCPTKKSSTSKTGNKESSKHTIVRNERHNSKHSDRRGQSVSAHKHISRSASDSVSKVSFCGDRRSRDQRSHPTKASDDEKRVTRSNEKLSATHASKSTMYNNNGLTCVAIDNINMNNTQTNTEGQRSRGQRSHSAKALGDQKRVTSSKEKSQSSVNSNSGSSHVADSRDKSNTKLASTTSDNFSEGSSCMASDKMRRSKHTSGSRHSAEKKASNHSEKKRVASNNSASCEAGSVTKNKTAVAGKASDIVSENNSHVANDKRRHRKHASGSRHIAEKKIRDHGEKKQVAENSLANCDDSMSNQTKIQSDHYDIGTNLVRADVPAREKNARPFDNTIMSSSAGNFVDISMPCTSLSNRSSVLTRSLSASPSLASRRVIGLKDVVEFSGKETADKEQKLVNSQETNVARTLSLSNAVEMQAGRDELVIGCVRHQTTSDLNSNSLSKSLQILSVDAEKQCADTGAAQLLSDNADNSMIKSADVVPDSCLLTVNDDMTAPVPASLLPQEIPAAFNGESPISLYRESEDIRSPSPMSTNVEEDDRSKEIRSPSPCDLESDAALSHIVETSWDVRLVSPCEIQSPDISDDEESNGIKDFSQHCNVCFHQGPVTIPLTTTEAGKGTHTQQPDIT